MIGKRNKIIVIQSRTTSTDAYGGTINVWAEYASVWAWVQPLKGRELIAAQAAQRETTTRFNICYIEGVTSDMRIVYDSKNYEIESVIDPDEAHAQLELMAKCL